MTLFALEMTVYRKVNVTSVMLDVRYQDQDAHAQEALVDDAVKVDSTKFTLFWGIIATSLCVVLLIKLSLGMLYFEFGAHAATVGGKLR